MPLSADFYSGDGIGEWQYSSPFTTSCGFWSIFKQIYEGKSLFQVESPLGLSQSAPPQFFPKNSMFDFWLKKQIKTENKQSDGNLVAPLRSLTTLSTI